MVICFNERAVHITDSWRIPKAEFGEYIALIFERYPQFRGGNRTSLRWEWAVHNFLYRVGYKRERTGSVDFESPQGKGLTALYGIAGRLVWAFIR